MAESRETGFGETRIWDRFYDEVIYLAEVEGSPELTLPDGTKFTTNIEQIKHFRKALQRLERYIESKES